MNKIGLVMEGGAMRGMFTCGVIDTFLENDIIFDGAVGSSAGAVFGCNFKSKQIGRALRYNKQYCNDKRYASFHSLITTGNLFNEEFCYHTLPYKLDLFDQETYSANQMDFYVSGTDVDTGEARYYNCQKGDEHDLKWFQASASIPLLSKIVTVDGYNMLDGGIADSIPLRFLENMGFSKNVVILTQPKNFVKEKNKFITLMKIKYRKYPNFIKTIANRHVKYNETLKYIESQEKDGNSFVIRPPVALNIGSTTKNPDELQRVYDIGRKTALENIKNVKDFILNNKSC